jgi:hypothetical protein
MKSLLCIVRFFTLFYVILLADQVQAQSDAGSEQKSISAGSKQIYIAAELACIGHDPAFPLDGTYSLENTLDLTGMNFTGIGNEQKPFAGSFYGNGHSIIGLSAKSNQDYTGLFRVIGKGALVQDLVIQAGLVQGKAYTGLLAGCNQGSIKNCCVQGQITGTHDVGGLVGINGKYGQIYTSQAIGIVKGDRYEIGGLVGCNLGYITDSLADIKVQGARVVGGLVGMNDETGHIEHCLTKGEVNGQYFVGGIAGHNWFRGIIHHCIAQADVMGEECVGGLAGANYAQAQIMKSSTSSKVQGTYHVGKVVGDNRGYVTYNLQIQDKWSSKIIKLSGKQ